MSSFILKKTISLALCWMCGSAIIVDGLLTPSSPGADRHNRVPSKGKVISKSPRRASLKPSPYPTRTWRPSGKNMNEDGGNDDPTYSPTLHRESPSNLPTKKMNAPSVSPSIRPSILPSTFSHTPSYRSPSPSFAHSALPSVKQSSSPSQLSHAPSYRSLSPSLKQSSSPSQHSHAPSDRSSSPSLSNSAFPSQLSHAPSYRSVPVSASPSLNRSPTPSYESSRPSHRDSDLRPSDGESIAPTPIMSLATSSPTVTKSTSPTDSTFRGPEPMPSFQDPITSDRCESVDGVFGSKSNSSVTIFFLYEVQYNASYVSESESIQTYILPSLERFMTKSLAKTVFTNGCANGRTNKSYASASVAATAMDDLQNAIIGISGWPMDRVITDVSCQTFVEANRTDTSSTTENDPLIKCRRIDGRMTINILSEEEKEEANAATAAATAAAADITRRTTAKNIRRRSNENGLLRENVATYAGSIIENLMLNGEMDHAHEAIIRVNFVKAKGQVIGGTDGDPKNISMEGKDGIGLNKEDGFSTYEKVLLGSACGVAIVVLFFGWICRKQYLVEKNIGDENIHQIDSQDTDEGTDDAPFETSQRLDFTMLCLDETTEADVLNEVEKELGLNGDLDHASDYNVEAEEVKSVGGDGDGDGDGIIGIERVHSIDDFLNAGGTIAVDDTRSSQNDDESATIDFE